MILVLSTLALAQDDLELATCPSLEESIALLRAEGSPRAYACTLAAEGAREALIEASAEGDHPERVTRALAVLRLQNLDEPIEPAEARALMPADVRLVNDGIQAHRGRRSPAPEHEAVFEKMGWYDPNPQFTNGLLTEQDQANIQILRNPPPPNAPPSAAEAMASAEDAPDPGPRGPCSCASAPAGLPLLGLLGLLSLRRRAGPGPSARRGRAAPPLRG